MTSLISLIPDISIAYNLPNKFTVRHTLLLNIMFNNNYLYK